MKAVHFGAGNIGRGFIGMMLSKSGYEVCFVTRNRKQVAALRQRQSYVVTTAGDIREHFEVKHVSALHIDDLDEVKARVADADLITTAVGAASLRNVAAQIAPGIELRLQRGTKPLHIMACENAIKASTQLKKWVYSLLPSELHDLADRLLAFPNTAVDRIVPVQRNADPLSVVVEPFSEWVIHKDALLEGFPGIQGAKFANSLEPYIERKLFTVNTGHSSAAYRGYLKGLSTIQEAMQNRQIRSHVEQTLAETSKLLVDKHGFDANEQQRYVNQTIRRFSNSALTDSITRVGRSPLRKLSTSERLVRPAMQAYDRAIPTKHLASSIASALHFDYMADPEAEILQLAIGQKGAKHIIRKHMGIPEEHALHAEIIEQYNRMLTTRD
ncbi:mannitol-1-phosphate 5-dehydrogenase [Paenibacillus glycanilyticus]|uniref:Mannitol-1-phosphate 5-dehydrogenase n=1 Tax=Paenibacillus glycanilyticus TaxID=126569 RepID=A0ABQ6G9S8_9BACL|nr:mannitol-1-phosphate 5-dehydrogenase [Paenibacillus glycanilyticus]GLX66805.1 mannitol-1-phosphate 5-dehydrogenase [Paenibacillus glycanilyticus]